MKTCFKRCSGAVASLVLIAAFGCGDPIPLKEMATARLEISKAVTVKAEKYAPQQLKDASGLLFTSHDNVKAEKYDDAKKNADDAFAKAKEAYDVAVPLLAKDAIDVADKSIKDSEDVFAAELANADYDAAVAKLTKAKSQNDAKDFYEAYKSALDADIQAKTARNLALSKKGTLQDAIADVKETVSRAEKLNAQAASPEKLGLAKANLAKAESEYQAMKLKDGFASVAVAKTNADGAYLEALKAYSASNIDSAAVLIGALETHKNAAAVKDEIAGSKELLATAKNLHDSGKYNESIQSSDEAKRIASSAKAVADKSAEDAAALVSSEAAAKAKASTAASGADGKNVVSDESSNGEFDFYVVQYFKDRARDCLWFIAGKFYNNPRKWPQIFDANKDQIKNPNVIRPGWKLRIPKLNPVKKVSSETVTPEPQKEIVPAVETAPEGKAAE